jgi:hypothetical protein
VIVVVGGSGRKVGKTTVMCEIIAATPEANWTAVKITPHAHERTRYGDTERYLAAGAVNALLTNELPAAGGNVIIESTSIVDVIKPDLFLFVVGSEPWKPTAAAHAARADTMVKGHVTPAVLDRIRQALQLQADAGSNAK